MEYAQGKVGRYFFVRFDHNDDIIQNLKDLAVTEKIKQAWFFCLGAVKRADIVTGPQTTVIPPVPLWHKIVEGHEVICIGNITWHDNEPRIHVHGSFGRSDTTRVGCMRQASEVFLTMECCIFEITHVSVVRQTNKSLGIDTLAFYDKII